MVRGPGAVAHIYNPSHHGVENPEASLCKKLLSPPPISANKLGVSNPSYLRDVRRRIKIQVAGQNDRRRNLRSN
jgi:hypothetical protein